MPLRMYAVRRKRWHHGSKLRILRSPADNPYQFHPAAVPQSPCCRLNQPHSKRSTTSKCPSAPSSYDKPTAAARACPCLPLSSRCIEALVERANVEEITSWQRANTFFQQQGYKKSTVVITDQGLAKAKYQSTLIHASGFVRSGGRLIFGGTFAALSSRSEINAVFKMLLLR